MTLNENIDAVRQAVATSVRSARSAVRKVSADGTLDAIRANAASIARSAADEARLHSKNGDVSKLRVAKAAFRPTRTARRLVAGALNAAASQALMSRRATSRTHTSGSSE